MRKILFFVCMFAIGMMHAQDDNDDTNTTKLTFEKGTNFVNGSLFFDTTKTITTSTVEQTNKRLGFGINTSYAHAISDNLFIGLGVGYSNNTRDNEITNGTSLEFTQNTFRVFPYVRYYKAVGQKLAFFVQGEAQFAFGKSKNDGQDIIETNNTFIGFRPGFTFMISRCFGIETTIGTLGYSNSNFENLQSNSENKINGFEFSLDSSDIIFGVSYYF